MTLQTPSRAGPDRDGVGRAALRFLTHDLRAPSSSILTLLELHRVNPQSMPVEELLRRIEGKTRESLVLADAFVQLHAIDPLETARVEPADLLRLATQAGDEVWPLARDAGVELRIEAAAGEATCMAEADSLQRAIEYLLGYAVRWSRAGGSVVCTVGERQSDGEGEGGWLVQVDDPGPGAAREKLAGGAETLDLRLAYAARVAARHGGVLKGVASVGAARWQLELPRGAAQPTVDASAGR